ncbi:MAG TPA: sialidase family protein [Streptosporangiaceae bacterium]|nr:sialidase family protein [Streptosporangiaceae bacterium]
MGLVTEISRECSGGNSEVEAATGTPGYVYDVWIGCGGIGFARSTDHGKHFGAPMMMPRSAGSSWDPSITVAPDGTVYAAYMHKANDHSYPIVAASFDHGATFPQVSSLVPPVKGNWGDRDFIAAGRNGDVYLTWDYGPSAAKVKFLCSSGGSCAFSAGDLNAVIQKSIDGGKTWGPITPVGPGFPRNGGYSAPLVVQPDGRVDVLYWGHYVSPRTYALHPGYEYFTSSRNGTTWPRHPLQLWPGNGSIALPVWWIDGDLARDSASNLYATWDTHTSREDIGWLSFSTDGGKTWSHPVRVTPDKDSAPHIVQVAGGRAGIAYVAWQTNASPRGYATYVRPFSIRKGWLGPAIKVSSQYGNSKIWPGDTLGIAVLPGGPGVRLAMSWGSAIGTSKNSGIYAAVVNLPATS